MRGHLGSEVLGHPGRSFRREPWVRQPLPTTQCGLSRDRDARGGLAKSSPRKWLTHRFRRALGMWQMVEQRCLMDRACPDGSLEPVSSLSYFTPFSRIFATWKGSPEAPCQNTELGRPVETHTDTELAKVCLPRRC